MKKRENFTKEGTKSKPFTIRFNTEVLSHIQKTRGLTKGQKIISFLEDLYKHTFNPVFGNPVIERNVPLKIQLHGQGEIAPSSDSPFDTTEEAVERFKEQNTLRKSPKKDNSQRPLTVKQETSENEAKSKYASGETSKADRLRNLKDK